MGANATQAQAFLLFLVAFIAIAGGFAANFNVLYILIGLAVLAGSIAVFLKCKPWEHNEE